MTSYLHYNQGETHFCAEDLLIAWQCQSLHEDIEARLRVTGFGHRWERVGGAAGAVRRREKGNDPFWTLSNTYSHAKIITVVAMLLYLETNISYTVIQFKLPVKTISHDDCAQLRWHICNGVLFHCTRRMTFKRVCSIFYFGKLILCVMWRFSIAYFFFAY